jgi:hypothetical protein
MGRANRPQGTDTEAEPRAHWTETHPDSEFWSPVHRALARTMSQDAYEAIYGRGEVPAEAEPRAADSPKEAEFIDISGLSDLEILAKLDELQASGTTLGNAEIVGGDLLHNPDANNREYQGAVTLERQAGGGRLTFCGQTYHGRAGHVTSHQNSVYRGDNLAAAIRAVNEKISQKLDKGYVSTGSEPRVSEQAARARISEILNPGRRA